METTEEQSPPNEQEPDLNAVERLEESHALTGILPPPPVRSATSTRRRERAMSVPSSRHDVREVGLRDQESLLHSVMNDENASDLFQALEQLDRLAQPQAARQVHSGAPVLSKTVNCSVVREKSTTDYHQPSRSRRPVTGVVTSAGLESLGLGHGTEVQSLMLDRVLGNRESRARVARVNLEEIRAQSTTRILGRRSNNRWRNLESTFKQFLVWVQDTLIGEDYESVDAAWKVLWFVESKLKAKHIEVASAYKYVKNLSQSLREAGVPVDEEVTTAYKESLKRDGALRAAKQAPPAEFKHILATEPLLTPHEYLGMRLAWVTASRIGEIQHLRKEHFEKMGPLLWSITFPYHKGDPYRLGTNIVVRVSEDLDKLLTARLEWVPSGQPVSNLTTARAAAALAAVHSGLTAHSVKRGALTRMLRAGVPLPMIQLIAKHKDLETLLVYLPRAEVSMALGTQDATALLEQA